MKTKTTKVETYWVGMTDEQVDAMKDAVIKTLHNNANPKDQMELTENEIEVLNDLRQSLLNI